MRLLFALSFVLAAPLASFAQTEDTHKAVEKDLANKRAAKWILEQEAPTGGFYLAPQDPNIDAKPTPSLRATNGAVRALKYLGFPLLNKEREKHAVFLLSCYDPKAGGFAEPGGKPDVTITSIGVMAAAELGIPHEKYAKALDYLKENAKTFEEVRIGAAAVEAWGVKDCPFKLDGWLVIALNELHDIADRYTDETAKEYAKDGGARATGSVLAVWLRLGEKLPEKASFDSLKTGQRDDGGWGKKDAKASDIETTYRVMRALMLLKEKPKDAKKLREFIESHRNKDGGFATKPGDKSSMSGAYYCVIVSKWLDDLSGK